MKEQFLAAIEEISVETEAILKEVNQQKKSHQEAQNSNRELQQIIEATGNGMWVIDLDYNIQRVNNRLANMLEFQKEDVIGHKCYKVFSGEKCQTGECPLNRIKQGEERVETESEIECRDGQIMTCAMAGAPFKNDQGEIIGIVEFLTDITEKKKVEERINFLAYHDHLTGLPNRTCFFDRLALELAHANRNNQMLAVLFVDLDGFKYVNDSMGHAIGDLLLKDVGRRLSKCIRASDTVARIGGDEFILLVPGLKRQQNAAALTKKIIKSFKEPWHVDNVDFQIQASIGIALYPGDGDDPDTLMDHADMAMYRAKKNKGKFQFYNYYMNEKLPEADSY